MSTNSINSPDMKLEVVLFTVSDVERTKAFYENLGWRFDIDVVEGDFRGVHLTPPNSDASILFGKGVIPNQSSSVQNLVLAVDDLDAAREYLSDRGVQVSEIFHYPGGPFNNTLENSRVSGRDPQGRSYFSFASFEDPDGNLWLLQEITTRIPGRLWDAPQTDVATLAALLRETAEHHDHYEKTHGEHHWSDWYAPYLRARQNGSSPEEAAAVADRYMDALLPVLSK